MSTEPLMVDQLKIGRLILGTGDADPGAPDIAERVLAILDMHEAPASGFARCDGEARRSGTVDWFRVETQGIGWTTRLNPGVDPRLVVRGKPLCLYVAVDTVRNTTMLAITSTTGGSS